MSDRSEQAREGVADAVYAARYVLRESLGRAVWHAHTVALAARVAELEAVSGAVVAEFDALLNMQWVEGYSASEVERLSEFRERFVVPLRAALRASGEGQGYIAWTCPECGKVVKGESHNVCEAPAEGGEA